MIVLRHMKTFAIFVNTIVIAILKKDDYFKQGNGTKVPLYGLVW